MLIDFEAAVDSLNRRQPVAIPTETVWGLAARWDDEEAIKKIFSLKGRPLTNPLIIHIASPETLLSSAQDLPPSALELIERFWPGGLTLVIPVREGAVLPIVRANLPTAAFRMPDHELTRALISQTAPLVAPSANRSGRPSATTPEHIENDFGPELPILQAPVFCRHGIESTILLWQGKWYLGRPGAIDIEEVSSVIGYKPAPHHPGKAPLCPGQLFRHYAPQATLTLHDSGWEPSFCDRFDGVLGYSDREYPRAKTIVSMGPSSNPAIIAANLYAALRDLDQRHLQYVFVDTRVENTSNWLGILDRLYKAGNS